MQTISTELKNILSADIISYSRTILLYPRYFDDITQTYKYETQPLDVTNQLVEGGTVRWKLDNENFNVWNISNVTLVFSNENNEWKQDFEKGYFPQGKLVYASRIVIKTGAVKSDDTTEDGYVFTGYIAEDPVINGGQKTITINLSGRFALLDNILAEDVSNTVTGELVGSDSGTYFNTLNNAVGLITSVRKGETSEGFENAVELYPCKEYSISDLNQKTSPAAITLQEALNTGESLWVSYRYWYTDKTLEWIIEQVMIYAGITDYEISKVNFESVRNLFIYDDSQGWQTGTLYYLEENENEQLKLTQLEFRPAPGAEGYNWIEVTHLYQTDVTHYEDGVSISGNYTQHPVNGLQISRPGLSMGFSAYGTWDFKMKAAYSSGNHQCSPRFYFASSSDQQSVTNGYAFQMDYIGSQTSVTLYKVSSGSLSNLWSTSLAVALSEIRVRISRNTSGQFRIWVMSTDGVTYVWDFGTVATDNTHTTYDTHLAMFIVTAPTSNTVTASITEVKTSETTSTGIGPYSASGYWQTPVLDTGGSLQSWGYVITRQTMPEGSDYIVETAVSDDGVNFDDWVEISSSGEILSESKRYIKVRWTGYCDESQTLTPILKSMQVTYYTGEIKIGVLNFTGMSCRQVIEELARMCNYEFGFDSHDKFLFRPRISASAPALTLDNSNTKKVVKISDGISRTYNKVSVLFGEYRYTVDSLTQNEASPTSVDKYGVRRYDISSGNLLPDESVDLAYAIAPTVWQYTHTPKKRATIATKYILHLELGDIVNVRISEKDIFKFWSWGDCDVLYGAGGYFYYNDNYLNEIFGLYDTDMRVEGIEFDISDWSTTFDLVEV